MLKYFSRSREVVGTVVIPSALLGTLILLPLLDRVLPRRPAHLLACGFVFAVVGGAGILTAQALVDDARNVQFREARERADAARRRAIELAAMPDVGIPPDGAGYLLRRDPLTQGKVVLERRCLGCHVLYGQGLGETTAPDLAGYGTRAWVRGLLDDPRSSRYFGKVLGCGGMAEWKKDSKLDVRQLDAVADFVASFALIPADTSPDEWLASPGVADHSGLGPFQRECGTCHAIEGFTEGGVRDAPGLFAWGPPGWIARMVRKPGAADRYGFLAEHRKMPAFGKEQVTDNDIDMVIRFLKEDYPRTACVPIPGSGSVAGSAVGGTAK